VTDGILTPCKVARSWHWFRHVTAPCNVVSGSRIVTVNSPSGTAPCNVIRGSGMTCHWICPVAASCNVRRSSESWHLICQVGAPCSVAGGSGMTCHWICPNVRHIGILHLVSISTSPQSTCHSAQSPKFYPNRTTLGRKKWSYLGFYRSNNGFFEKPNYNLLNCLFCQKIAFLHFGVNIQDDECPPSWILGVP